MAVRFREAPMDVDDPVEALADAHRTVLRELCQDSGLILEDAVRGNLEDLIRDHRDRQGRG